MAGGPGRARPLCRSWRIALILLAAFRLSPAVAIGIVPGTPARSMARFGLRVRLVIMTIVMLSGGQGSAEGQPGCARPITRSLPSRQYPEFAGSVVFRGAGAAGLAAGNAAMAGLGALFLQGALALFRRSMSP